MTKFAAVQKFRQSRNGRGRNPPLPVTSRHTLPLARALSAALLTLALLSGALPFAALSASHSCSMPCCAGGACATGACQGALFKSRKKQAEEKLCGAEQSGDEHGGAKKSHAAHARPQAPAKPSSTSEREANAVKARALAAVCSSDCCAATSASTQSRRGREQALLSASGLSPELSFISLSTDSDKLEKVSSAHLKRLRARAPPAAFPV